MNYTLKRNSRSQSVKIRLTHEGTVEVSAPFYTPKFAIEAFVKKTEPWILHQMDRLKLKQTANPTLNWEEGLMSYIGHLYYIKHRSVGDKVCFENGICWINPVTGQVSDIKKTLVKWLKLQAEVNIRSRVVKWALQMNVQYGTVRFGQQSSRWGSCSADNNLRFNWRLIHFSSTVIDYVVIHELSHTVHHNHSGRFWQLVEQYCPTWKAQRQFLKRQLVVVEKI